jgi:hypothetical protein
MTFDCYAEPVNVDVEPDEALRRALQVEPGEDESEATGD